MKNKTLCLLGSLILFSTMAVSQDQLFKKDNTRLLVKVVEINSEVIKYKLFDNLNGPLHSDLKSDVSLIIYENGQHEVISSAAPAAAAEAANTTTGVYSIESDRRISKADSLLYFSHTNNISINFLNFFNNEIGLTYQKDFLKSQFNIIIPVVIGVQKPNITQDVYFGNSANYNTGYSQLTLTRKLFDVGFGINYYPSLRSNLNYYIGPAFKYMQFNARQDYNYSIYNGQYYGSNASLSKNVTMSRYTMSITNGLVLRTRSRITASIFGSLGFKNDVVSSPALDPITNAKINPIRTATSLYFWCGFNVGFNF